MSSFVGLEDNQKTTHSWLISTPLPPRLLQVRDVFSKPAYHCPELLLLALAAVPSEVGGNLRVEMLSRLLPLYFRPNRNTHAAALIRRLWQVNPRLVVQSGVKAFNVDSTLPSVVYVSVKT